MTTQRYGRTQNQALLVEIEAVAGTAETPDAATQAVPCEPFTVSLNPTVLESNEATGSLIKGRKVVADLQPRLTATVKMRGSGAASTEPRIAALLKVGGLALRATTTRLPAAAGVINVASGGVSTLVFDRTDGTGLEFPATDALAKAALIGRPITLAVTATTTHIITNVSFDTPNMTITFSPPAAVACGATTEAVLPACVLYEPTSTIPTLTAWAYRDGKLLKFSGCRSKNVLTMPGGERATLACDLSGVLVEAESDASVPGTIDISTLPAEPIWRNGIATIKNMDVGCSSFTLDMQTQDSRYPNPNLLYGRDLNVTTSMNPGGTIVTNDKLKATHDIVADLGANTLMPIVAATDLTGSAGTRFAICIPNALLLDRQDGDREGIMENQLPYQAVSVSPAPSFTFAFF